METKNKMELIEHLYAEMFSKLLRLARISGYGKDDAYELVQDTFVAALRNIDRLVASNNREGWLTVTLQNLIRNDRKRRSKKPATVPLADEDFELGDGETQGWVLPDNDEYTFETDDFFIKAVGKSDYELFKDVRIYKLSHEELEAKYGTKAINCQNRASRIKKKMIKAMKNIF